MNKVRLTKCSSNLSECIYGVKQCHKRMNWLIEMKENQCIAFALCSYLPPVKYLWHEADMNGISERLCHRKMNLLSRPKEFLDQYYFSTFKFHSKKNVKSVKVLYLGICQALVQWYTQMRNNNALDSKLEIELSMVTDADSCKTTGEPLKGVKRNKKHECPCCLKI